MEIQFQNVAFRYESRKEENSVSGLNFTVQSGEFILICGPSGSGKSTVGRIINGLIPCFYQGELTGSVLLNGTDMTEIPQVELAGMVGSVFQNPRTQFFDTNSTGELAFGCENMGYPPEQIHERIRVASDAFGLTPLLDWDIFELSGGEKQKIAFGSIYAVDPDVYVFDEPSSNLDHASIRELAGIMAKLKAAKKTIILIEHRIHYVSDLADRIFYMKNGYIEQIFSRQEFELLDTDVMHKMGLRTALGVEAPTSNVKAPGKSAASAVQIKALDFRYKKRKSKNDHALLLRDLQIPAGKIIALIGENGAGKSTFLKCICGLEKGEKANVADETGVLNRRQRLKDSYLVMQDVNHQLFTESVADELLLSDPSLTKEQITACLSQLDLDSFAEDHPMSLSGGQKQRVAVAAALAAKKKYIYLDEPTSGLDYLQMKNMSKAIKSIRARASYILIVTHDPEFILECCDHVIELHKGAVRLSYTLDTEGLKELVAFFENRNSLSPHRYRLT